MQTNIITKTLNVPAQKEFSPVLWKNPGRAICRDGKIINTEGEILILFDKTVDTQINWELVKVNPTIKNVIKGYVFYKIEQQTAQAASTVFISLKYFSQTIEHLNSLGEITFTNLQNYLNETRHADKEWRFGHIRRWYEWCNHQEMTGFDLEILNRLKKLKVASLSPKFNLFRIGFLQLFLTDFVFFNVN